MNANTFNKERVDLIIYPTHYGDILLSETFCPGYKLRLSLVFIVLKEKGTEPIIHQLWGISPSIGHLQLNVQLIRAVINK